MHLVRKLESAGRKREYSCKIQPRGAHPVLVQQQQGHQQGSRQALRGTGSFHQTQPPARQQHFDCCLVQVVVYDHLTTPSKVIRDCQKLSAGYSWQSETQYHSMSRQWVLLSGLPVLLFQQKAPHPQIWQARARTRELQPGWRCLPA